MIKYIDNFLNNITMYRLVLYLLSFLLIIGFVLSFFELLSFTPLSLVLSTSFFVIVSLIINKAFSIFLKIPTNIESVYISAFILSLIVLPTNIFRSPEFFFWVTFFTIVSKYVINIKRKHIFNPVAFGVTLTALLSMGGASWWVGNIIMLPVVLFCGVLIVRKINRFDLIFYFFLSSILAAFALSIFNAQDPFTAVFQMFTDSPILFFAFVMLTEPLTTPYTKKMQSFYGALVGFLFAPQVNFFSFYLTPENALLVGNIFSYIVSPKERLVLSLKEKIQIAPTIYEFILAKKNKFSYIPGQYMEWTLRINNPDTRGNRRYLTIASSPTEDDIRIGIRYYENPSSFKKNLIALEPKEAIIAGSLAGDFVLPKDKSRKLAFIAGGIGITPFRSIIKYLLDKNEKRDIVSLYINKTQEDIVYKDIFQKAYRKLGIKTVDILTGKISSNWKGEKGNLSEERLRRLIPDFSDREFYISGSQSVVTSSKTILKKLGVKNSMIKTDYFPGYA